MTGLVLIVRPSGAMEVSRHFVRENGQNTHIYHACVPPDTTRSQLVKIFAHYAEQHPDELNHEAFPVVIESLQHAYPCTSKQHD